MEPVKSTKVENINFSLMTNDDYKKIPKFEITYGTAATKFGYCLLALHDEQICYLSLFDEGKENSAIDHLQGDWPSAVLHEDNAKAKDLVERIFDGHKRPDMEVLLRGTQLQCDVWMELAKVREGSTVSYEQIAKAVGKPRAIRAVASAIAKNKVAYVVPCHRVVRKTGAPNKYRWGPERKVQILKYESEP